MWQKTLIMTEAEITISSKNNLSYLLTKVTAGVILLHETKLNRCYYCCLIRPLSCNSELQSSELQSSHNSSERVVSIKKDDTA